MIPVHEARPVACAATATEVLPPRPRTHSWAPGAGRPACHTSRTSKESRTNSAVPSSPVLRRPTQVSPSDGTVNS